MVQRTPPFALAVPQRQAGTSACRWLCVALRGEILEGRLRPGDRLTSTRALAKQYALSRGTVVSAFDQLKSEGYLEGAVGSGTYVSQILPDDLLQVSRRAVARPPVRRIQPLRVSAFARRVNAFPGFTSRPTRAFRTDQPALDLFPTTLWAQLTARRLRRATTSLLLGCSPMGYPPLQRALADYLRTSRGVNCAPQQIAIVSGVQEALDLVARVIVNPGDRVCMENPGYTGAALVFRAVGAKIVTMPVDQEGMRVPDRHLPGVRLAYVTPGHQFPLGMAMSLRRRLKLLEWARQSGVLIFEDDYDSEYRYSGHPVPALQGMDRHGLVLFAGSFSKVLFPSIRLGYLVVPSDLVDSFAAIRSVTTRHAPLLEQASLCDFIAQGHFGRHVRRMREVYAERRSVLLECAQQRLTGLLQIIGVEAGLQTAGWLGGGIDGESAARAAAALDVEVTPLSRYCRGRSVPAGLQLGFAAIDPLEIRRGILDLSAALEALAESHPSDSTTDH